MWVCPKCGRSFKNTEQSHYCGKPPATIEEYIAARLTEYKTSKGAIQLPYSKSLPLELIGEIAKWCEENS